MIDSLEALPAGAARRLFGAARKLEEGGSLTVIAASGMAWEPQRQASTRIALDGPSEDGGIQVAAGALGRAARGSHRLGAQRMPDPAREPETPDEELLEAETAAIARLYTDEDRVERMAGELRSGFATLSGLRPGVSVFGSARTDRDDPQYEAAREVARRLGEDGLHRDHRRRAGDHGGGQPRRRRRGRAVGRPGHRPPARAGAERVGRPAAPVPLLLHPQGHVRALRLRVRGLPRRASAPSTSCSRRPRCARPARSAGSRSCCSAATTGTG